MCVCVYVYVCVCMCVLDGIGQIVYYFIGPCVLCCRKFFLNFGFLQTIRPFDLSHFFFRRSHSHHSQHVTYIKWCGRASGRHLLPSLPPSPPPPSPQKPYTSQCSTKSSFDKKQKCDFFCVFLVAGCFGVKMMKGGDGYVCVCMCMSLSVYVYVCISLCVCMYVERKLCLGSALS